MFRWHSERTMGGLPLDEATRYQFEKWCQSQKKDKRRRNQFISDLELAVGAEVMVTLNIDTDLDIANGTRATVVQIVLDPEEPPFGNEQVIELKFLPVYILVKLERTRAEVLPGLDPNVIPILPVDIKHTLPINTNAGIQKRTIVERQFPVTLGYAFTDYRAQGQTMSHVIVDIAKPPPPNNLTLFNIYVALSRSSGRDSIRLLRGYTDTIRLGGLPLDLFAEDDRLEALDRETTRWWNQVLDGTA
jgi:hypothetical protein